MQNWNLGAIGSGRSSIPTREDYQAARVLEGLKLPAIRKAETSAAQAKMKFDQGLLAESDYINICYQAWLLAKADTRS
jgi:hypothetical protein